MVYKYVFTKSAEKDLVKLDNVDAVRILKKLENYIKLRNPLVRAKKMKGFEMDTFRYRVGDYRVVFRFDKKMGKLVILVILRVLHRKEVYRKV